MEASVPVFVCDLFKKQRAPVCASLGLGEDRLGPKSRRGRVEAA